MISHNGMLVNSSHVNCFRVEVRALDYLPDLLEVFRCQFLEQASKFFLESSIIKPGFSRFSFMGDAGGPLGETIRYYTNSKKVTVETAERTDSYFTSSIFDFLEDKLNQRKVFGLCELPFDFNLGYVGFLGYELKAETIGDNTHTAVGPDVALIFASRIIAFDHQDNKTYLLHLVSDSDMQYLADQWFDEVENTIKRIAAAPTESVYKAPHLPMTLADVEKWIAENANIRHDKCRYLKKIADALQDITDGETYEVCLTNIVEFDFTEAPFDLYCVMRAMSPAPHAAYFCLGDYHLVCASPERFISVDRHRHVEAKPIKGTRPRGKSPEEDHALIENLKTHEKDRAENLMIVDLLRNDLGQVCMIPSVTVPRLFDVETYSHVHQLVSTIAGTLKKDVSAIQCVRAVFPGGSMTGAPKKRTMEIIDRLEEGPRGAYSGALGWFGLSGTADLNIIIRSISIHNGKATFGVGGALTALSDPEDEFLETMVKARGLVEAVERLRGMHA